MTLETVELANTEVGRAALPKLREAINELAAQNVLSDAQLVRYAREAVRRARLALRDGDRTAAWQDYDHAAALLRAAKPNVKPRGGDGE